jgi:hypothetical protein
LIRAEFDFRPKWVSSALRARGDRLLEIYRLIAFAISWATFAFAFAFGSTAEAAEIVLERTGVEKLVVQAMFKDRGRLVLASGPCSSYLDQPSVALANGRIQIRSHLLARVGVVVNGDCAGLALKSWTKVSGRPVASGGTVRLEDIRIDEVDDPDTRAVLLNTGLVRAMPKAVTLDVQSAVQAMLTQSIDQIQATIETFVFQDVAVVGDRLSMKFDFKLVGR